MSEPIYDSDGIPLPDSTWDPLRQSSTRTAEPRTAAGRDKTHGAVYHGTYIWKVEEDPTPIWCFGERKRLPGRWELRGWWEKGTVPDDSVRYWEPIWVYRCSGCNKDQRSCGWYEAPIRETWVT